jgi:hypothetical protein
MRFSGEDLLMFVIKKTGGGSCRIVIKELDSFHDHIRNQHKKKFWNQF